MKTENKTGTRLLSEVDKLRSRVAELERQIDDLKGTKEYARNIIDSSMDMIIAVDSDRRIIEFNKAAEETFGYLKDEVLGKHVSILYSDIDEGESVYRKTLKDQRNLREIVNRRKNGELFPTLLSASVLQDFKGNQVGLMGVSRDITESKRREERLRRSEEKHRILSGQLAESNSMKELLLDIITHDLKNPVGVISGIVSMIRAEKPENEEARLLQECCDNLVKVLEDATVLSQVATGEDIVKEDLDLKEIIGNMISEFSPTLEAYGMTLDYLPEEDLTVRANPIIKEVLRNYISNAIEHASSGKRVVVEATKKDSSIIVAVKDFGRTIPENDRQRIFQPRIQLRTSTQRGRGMGLSIVARIAAAHGGKVWADPNKPTGNVFNLQLPLESSGGRGSQET
ncbi:MAG: PAS domain S-box protein [Fidelibacterota bacterium]